VDQEREALMRRDQEWGGTTKDVNKFASYYAPDASLYLPGMPVVTGAPAIKDALTQASSQPDFSLTFTPTKASVSSSGDVGYTSGTYQMGGEKGKYVTIWKKQQDGQWMVAEDIASPDKMGPPPTTHVMTESSALTWMDAPPSLPKGAKIAVISGDPSKPGPFVIRAQVSAGYKVPPHWHPGDENLTILSGTVALGMGDTWDDSKLKTVGTGGYAGLPAEMRHYFLAKTASTFQVHGMGPFVVNYVNPSDDPSKK
jgi:ketosteroid isomerase-like protein